MLNIMPFRQNIFVIIAYEDKSLSVFINDKYTFISNRLLVVRGIFV